MARGFRLQMSIRHNQKSGIQMLHFRSRFSWTNDAV